MSALEQIRKRPALVISVLGVALLLFIITLAWDNKGGNPFSNPNRMAKVDGVEIEYPAFRDATAGSDNNQDMAVTQDRAMQQLISTALFEKAAERAGVTVGEAEISDLLFNPEVNPQAEMYLQQYNLIYHPEKLGLTAEQMQSVRENQAQMRAQWEQGIEELSKQRVQSKYLYLLTGALTANKLDVKDFAQLRNDISDVRMATLPASTIKDEDVKVTDADIKARYDKERNRWLINQEIRPVTVIRQYIEPSDEDIKAADALVAKTAADLRDTDGIQAIADNYAFTSTTVSAPANRLPMNVKDSVGVLMNDTVVILKNAPRNHRNIAKLLSAKTMVDSVKIDLVMFDPQSIKADSVMTLLASGADLTGNTSVVRQDSIPLTLADAAYAGVRDMLTEAPFGQFVEAEAGSPIYQLDPRFGNAGLIYRVIDRDAPVTVYDIAVIDYRVEPSAKTVDDLTTKLREYANTNNTAEAFAKNAADAQLPATMGRVSNTSFAVQTPWGPMPDSSKAARWALEAKKGQVSDVLNGQERRGQGDPAEYIMVVALNDIYDGDYVPVTAAEVKEYYEPIVLNELKAAKLLEQYNGKAKNVDGYAKAMGVNAINQSVSIGRYGNEFAGKVAAAKKGALVGPFVTPEGITVFTVTNVNAAPEADYEMMKNTVRQQMFGGITRQLPAILVGRKHISGDVTKFINNQ